MRNVLWRATRCFVTRRDICTWLISGSAAIVAMCAVCPGMAPPWLPLPSLSLKAQRCPSRFLHSPVLSSEATCYVVLRLRPILSLWIRPCSSSSSQQCLQNAVCYTSPVVQAVLALRRCGLLSALTDSVLVMRLGSVLCPWTDPSELILYLLIYIFR